MWADWRSASGRLRSRPTRLPLLTLLLIAIACSGCGSTKQRVATDQLLLSSAVDQAVSEIDFRPLAGQRLFFDTQYIKDSKTNRLEVGDAASGYVVSSLRQQMAIAGCLLVDDLEDADFVVEARVGALGSDASEVIYGVPSTNVLGAAITAASIVSTTPAPAAIPEIAFARRDNRRAAAKVIAYAYHRPTRRVVWQSGRSQAQSTAEDRWMLGAGPFQKGTIYDGVSFAGNNLTPMNAPLLVTADSPDCNDCDRARLFVEPSELVDPQRSTAPSEVRHAGHSIEPAD